MNFGKEKDCFSKNIKVQKAGVLYKQRFRGGGKWQKRCFVLKDGAYGVTRHSALSTERESRRATTYTHSPQPRARCGPGRACVLVRRSRTRCRVLDMIALACTANPGLHNTES